MPDPSGNQLWSHGAQDPVTGRCTGGSALCRVLTSLNEDKGQLGNLRVSRQGASSRAHASIFRTRVFQTLLFTAFSQNKLWLSFRVSV